MWMGVAVYCHWTSHSFVHKYQHLEMCRHISTASCIVMRAIGVASITCARNQEV